MLVALLTAAFQHRSEIVQLLCHMIEATSKGLSNAFQPEKLVSNQLEAASMDARLFWWLSQVDTGVARCIT
jgi:hypothetical protein